MADIRGVDDGGMPRDVAVDLLGKVKVSGPVRVSAAIYQRSAATTQYTAGDVIGDGDATLAAKPLAFEDVVDTPGGSGILASVTIAHSAAEATALLPELWLFSAPPTMVADNAAWTLTDADILNCVAVISFSSSFIGYISNNTFFQAGEICRPFVCPAGVRRLYGVLIARNAYTPLAGETFKVRLGVLSA